MTGRSPQGRQIQVRGSLTEQDLRRFVADALDEQANSIGFDDNLIELGVDSIQIMRLTNQLRQRGVEVSFAELAERPTLDAWSALLASGTQGHRLPASGAEGHRPERAAGTVPTGDRGDPSELSSSVLLSPLAPFPLALMQHAYWIGRGDGQALGSVSAHLYVEFDGRDVDPARLGRAVEAVVDRHAMLRVKIGDDGTQRVLACRPGPAVTVGDLRELPADEVERTLEQLRDQMSHQMLAIEDGQVVDVRLSLLPGGATRLHLDIDMVAADAMSYRILLADLAALYEHPGRALDPIGYSYAGYLGDRAAARAAAHERDRQWWAERLDELPGAPHLPVTPRAAGGGTGRVARRHHWLPAPEKARLIERAHRHGVTPAMALATAFAEVLAAWADEPRFLLNLPLFNREALHPDVDAMVGDFTGSVLLDVDCGEPMPFAERARRIQQRLHLAGAHADYSGVEVLRDMARVRGEQVFAPVVFTSALNLGELFDDRVRRHFGEPVWIISQGPQVLLDAQVTEVGGGLLLNWDVREDGFPDGVVDAMFAAYRDVVGALATENADTDKNAGAGTGMDEKADTGADADVDAGWRVPVSITTPPDQGRARLRVAATGVPPPGALLHDGFFAHAHRTPGAPALRWGNGGTLTYAELADRALRVAGCLVERGVRPGESVSVEAAKGPAQAVAVLGVLAAGAVYVPIGVEQPHARREKIRRTADVRVALTERDGPAGPGGQSPGDTAPDTSVVELDVDVAAVHRAPLADPVVVGPEAVAYILFTSGSTGEPKGVEVPHRAAMNTIGDLIGRFDIGPRDASLAVSALDFDLSVFDMFGLWSAGGAVVLITEDARRDAAHWADLVDIWDVTVINCVPAVLEMLLRAGGRDGWGERLRVALLGGDWVGTHLPALLARHAPTCRFVALGGTTETAIHSTICEVTEPAGVPPHWRAVPYGTPLRGVTCRVVDEQGRDRPDWVPGELWIGGLGVARGYRGDPQRTADRFVEYRGTRWYRTGDMARYWPDGTLEFLGRRDGQVKVRGFRIELAEVEAAFTRQPGVHRAVAVVIGGDSPRLATAVVTQTAVDDDAPSARTTPGTTVGTPAEVAEALRDATRDLLP
uniref:non-ribosomal peptide synthetase n=1 Tax=Candidatus Protofrankia californiensis TaxID=1839754 RepID=UPI001041775A